MSKGTAMEKEMFLQELNNKTEEINEIIYNFLPIEEGYQKIIFEAMNYSIKAGGKRLRPMLMFETYKLFAKNDEIIKEIYSFMTAIECIHTYSLVHDDLPAMDNDDYRRGMLTTHKKYGHAMGVLAGDALLNYAYEVVGDAMVFASDDDKVNIANAFGELSKKAGIYGMVGGQTVDVTLTGKSIDEKTLNFIYDLKTGALIEASMVCGAILAGAESKDIAKVRKIAKNVGLAFQIEDDILDVVSTTEELGKPVLSDEKNDKTTYVTLYGIEKAKEMAKEKSKQAIELLDSFEEKNDFLRELLLYLVSRKK